MFAVNGWQPWGGTTSSRQSTATSARSTSPKTVSKESATTECWRKTLCRRSSPSASASRWGPHAQMVCCLYTNINSYAHLPLCFHHFSDSRSPWSTPSPQTSTSPSHCRWPLTRCWWWRRWLKRSQWGASPTPTATRPRSPATTTTRRRTRRGRRGGLSSWRSSWSAWGRSWRRRSRSVGGRRGSWRGWRPPASCPRPAVKHQRHLARDTWFYLNRSITRWKVLRVDDDDDDDDEEEDIAVVILTSRLDSTAGSISDRMGQLLLLSQKQDSLLSTEPGCGKPFVDSSNCTTTCSVFLCFPFFVLLIRLQKSLGFVFSESSKLKPLLDWSTNCCWYINTHTWVCKL